MFQHGEAWVACEECTRNCQLVHSNKLDFSPCVSRFFALFIEEEVSQAMILPPKFARTVKDLVDQETKLEDSSGMQWTATLSFYQGQLAFHKGWKEFSCDHGLKKGNLLLFNYIKGSHFVVHIFDRSCCENMSSKKNLSVKRARVSEKTDSEVQATNTNAMNSDKNGPLVKRARTSGKTASQETPGLTFHTNGINSNKNGPSVSARTGENLATQDTLCPTSDNNARNAQSSSASVPSVLDLKNIQIQPITASETNPEFGNAKQASMDEAFCVIIERDAGYAQPEDRTCLYDLSVFEIENKCLADKYTEGTNGEDTPSHADRTVISQSDAYFVKENPIGTAVLNVPTASKVSDIRMFENQKDLRPMDDMPCEHEKFQSDGPSGSYVKHADNCRKGDNLSNVANPLQNAERSNGNDGKSPFSEECASLNTVNPIKVLKKEQLGMDKQTYGHAQKSRRLQPSTAKECGSSSQGVDKVKIVKVEPVDSLDVPQVLTSISCLAVTNGRDFIELDERLPSITFRKGRQERRSLLLRDPEGRRWPALYMEQSGFFILKSGWKYINEANGVRPGDYYVFSPQDEPEGDYNMGIVRNQEGN